MPQQPVTAQILCPAPPQEGQVQSPAKDGAEARLGAWLCPTAAVLGGLSPLQWDPCWQPVMQQQCQPGEATTKAEAENLLCHWRGVTA